MKTNDLMMRIDELEAKIRHLERKLDGITDHPKTDLLPLLPTVVTSENHLTLSLSGTTLLVGQRGRILGSVVLLKEG